MYRILNNRNRLVRLKYDKGIYVRRESRDPLREGSLKKLAQLIVWPIAKACPKKTSLDAWLAHMFGCDERTIERYKVIEPFMMTGMPMEFPLNFTGITESKKIRRNLKVDQVLWIRQDRAMPDRIDIEVIYLNGESMVFKLDQAEFTNVTKYIQHDPYKCHLSTQR